MYSTAVAGVASARSEATKEREDAGFMVFGEGKTKEVHYCSTAVNMCGRWGDSAFESCRAVHVFHLYDWVRCSSGFFPPKEPATSDSKPHSGLVRRGGRGSCQTAAMKHVVSRATVLLEVESKTPCFIQM